MRLFQLFAICLFFNAFSTSAMAAQPLSVVTSFSILRDMIEEIGGQDVTVTSFVGPDDDAHAYQPTPIDLKAVQKADLVIVNGLHFDDWMLTMVSASETKAKIIVASQNIKPLTRDNHEVDPHAWQDLRNGIVYVNNITNALNKASPEKSAQINKRAEDYIKKIKKMDSWIRSELALIPTEKRKIITSHDAFGYFETAYNIKFLAPLGVNPEAEPSASNIVSLIKQIKQERVSTLFLENMSNPKLMNQIAKETNTTIGGELYADALSAPDGTASTYLDMFKSNLNIMKKAMTKNN